MSKLLRMKLGLHNVWFFKNTANNNVIVSVIRLIRRFIRRQTTFSSGLIDFQLCLKTASWEVGPSMRNSRERCGRWASSHVHSTHVRLPQNRKQAGWVTGSSNSNTMEADDRRRVYKFAPRWSQASPLCASVWTQLEVAATLALGLGD